MKRSFAYAAASLVLALSPAAHAQLDVPPEPPDQPQQPPPAQQQKPPPTVVPPVPPPPLPPGQRPEDIDSGPYRSVVHASPQWTQDRSFTSTRFWRLDPGTYEVETWLRTRIQHEFNGSREPAELLFQNEIEIGLTKHLQIDIYENLTFNVEDDGKRGIQQEGVQLEARISLGSYYNQYFLNPVLYLEYHPRHNDADRAEVRILLGQGFLDGRLYFALNPYFETNVTPSEGGKYILDAEVGTTAAVGVKITEWLRLSAELKIGGDMLGDPDNKFHFVAWAGPGFIFKPLPGKLKQYFKVMGTVLFDLIPRNNPNEPNPQAIEPLFIVGSQF